MSKWADYGVSGVQFDASHALVRKVRVQLDIGDKFGSVGEYTRSQLIAAIKNKITFITISLRENGKWKKGSPVSVVNIKGREYLKTLIDPTEEDDLGELAEFSEQDSSQDSVLVPAN